MTDVAIEFKNCTKKFGNFTAIDNLSLRCSTGQILGLAGPNGAGKSTLIKLAMGILKPTSGSVQTLHTCAFENRTELAQDIRFVPPQHSFYPWMTVREILRFAEGLSKKWSRSLADQLCEMLELPPNRRTRELSTGMQAKLGLVVALAGDPTVLLLDEPFSNLDPLVREDLTVALNRSAKNSNQTIVVSSHQLDELEQICDDVAIISHGRVLRTARTVDLRTKSFKIAIRSSHCAQFVEEIRLDQLVACYPQGDIHELIIVDASAAQLEAWRNSMGEALQQISNCGLDRVFKSMIRESEKSIQ